MKAIDRKWLWIGSLLLLAVLLVLPFLVKNYRVFQFNLVLVYAVAILGLNVLTGFNGQISLGHGAFYAFGAYTAAIMMDKMACRTGARCRRRSSCASSSASWWLPGLAAGGALPGAWPPSRCATGRAAAAEVQEDRGLTGGVQGIVLTKPEPPFSLPLPRPALQRRPLAVLLHRWRSSALMFLLVWNLLRGRVGRALIAVRDHPIAATAMGINLPVFKSMTFGVSAGVTGLAGALGAIVVAFVSPDSFTVNLSIFLLVAWWWAGWRRSPGRSSAASSSSSCPTSPTRSRSRRRRPSTAWC